MSTPAELEAARIAAEYARREREVGVEFYALTNPANLFIRHGQQRALLSALGRAGALPLAGRRILEVGCGRGQWLTVLEDFGATREQLCGIDLDAARLADAERRYPRADLRVGDATALPWPDASFELVLQSTMLSSILDPAVRRAVADEMRRVLAPGGAVISYDLRYDNPRNRAVRGLSAAELARLFPGCAIDTSLVTLAPPLVRRIAARSWLAATALERLRIFNTHLLAVITAPRPATPVG